MERLDREHVTDGGECWCRPEHFIVCPECEEQEHGGCWRCRHDKPGFLRVGADYEGEEPKVVIHREILTSPTWPV